MKKWLFCIWWFSLAAQAQKADSLVGVLKKAPRDTNKVNTLFEVGRAYWREGNDSLARLYCDQSIALAQQLHYPRGEVKARLQLVRIEFEYLTDLKTAYAHLDIALKNAQSIPDKSLEGQVYLRRAQLYESFFEKQSQVNPLLNKALRLFIEANDLVWQGTVYAEMATLLTNEGKYAEAVDLMLKARRLQEKANDINALRSTIPNLGTFYASLGRYKDALQCYKDAEKIADKLNDLRLRAYVIGQRADIHEKQKQYPEALKAFQEAAKIHEMTRSTQWLPRTYGRIGGVYFQLKDYKKALYYTTIADSVYKNEIDSKESLEHVCQINFGNIFLAQKQYDKVIKYATAGIEWASSSQPPLRRELAEYHRQLAEAYTHLGKPALALGHFKQFKSESDSLINNEVLQKTMVSSMTYDFEKKQQGNKLRIQTLENEKLTQTRNILLGLSAIGLLGLAFVLWYNRRLKLKNQELSRKNREIEEALFKGQKIERKRVASELHDNLNTKLAALRWHLEAMQTDELNGFNQKIHDKLLEMANDVYADVRLISHNMLPAELETHGLASALQKLVEKLTINTKTQFHLVVTNPFPRLPSSVEHQLYTIVLELVNNVIKHAQATEVWLSLSHNENQLSLTVSDDGIGMPQEIHSDGMGMQNLKNRVETLQGVLRIESEPRKGTKVSVTIQL
ncbi:signal transduction histidine kinase [Runella defluvii]|uniref:Oxygen sensor histidine kinase NreB n=1 Tax=Runella defluvii TaxID=370973 RepID=A0A7W5ZMZ1_9BACT|nr:tetratricopeptide repeat protein [Runella defluvii]MBB3840333.1 signal transduction histidine kinase [Runella defluvii]